MLFLSVRVPAGWVHAVGFQDWATFFYLLAERTINHIDHGLVHYSKSVIPSVIRVNAGQPL